MKNSEMIVWNDSLMTGVNIIDEQHQILVTLINEANTRITENCGRGVLEDIIKDLMSYALYHFDTEEELMLDGLYGQEDQEAHFLEHRRFSNQVARMQQELQQGVLIPREKLTTFLTDWLINHILKTDMKMAKFLTESRGQL